MFTDDASSEEIRKARIAFYAGAVSVLSALTAAAETGEDKVVIRALRQIQREICQCGEGMIKAARREQRGGALAFHPRRLIQHETYCSRRRCSKDQCRDSYPRAVFSTARTLATWRCSSCH